MFLAARISDSDEPEHEPGNAYVAKLAVVKPATGCGARRGVKGTIHAEKRCMVEAGKEERTRCLQS